jgi:hypothetical protein
VALGRLASIVEQVQHVIVPSYLHGWLLHAVHTFMCLIIICSLLQPGYLFMYLIVLSSPV